VYLRGTGGLEVLIADDHDPFDTHAGYELDIDVVLRDRVDLSEFKLFIGCGSCDPDEVPIAPPVIVDHLGAPVVEAFTQTSYRHALHGAQLKFNTSALSLANCPERRFSIRLQEQGGLANIRWAAVVGLRESFTAFELFSFGVYVLANHGAAWTDLAFTSWLCFLLVGLCFVALVSFEYDWLIVSGIAGLQQICFGISLVAFVATFGEMLLHLLIVQSSAPLAGAFWVGLIFVAFVPNAAGAYVAYQLFFCARHPTCDTRLWSFCALFVGIFLYFVFGAGLYIGPTGIVVGTLLWILRDSAISAPGYEQATPTKEPVA
jgi:hypothetical protein